MERVRVETSDGPQDQVVFDLDPSRDDVAVMLRATRGLGDLLDELGLTTFVKTTGSKGYHVHVPLHPVASFDDVRQLARAVAERLVDRDPST